MAWAASIQQKTEMSLAHTGSLEDNNFEAGNERGMPREKRSPQFSLAKKVGYTLGTWLTAVGKTIGKIPIWPLNFPYSITAKVVGSATKGAAKFGQILL